MNYYRKSTGTDGKLLGSQFEVVYVENKVADALSRQFVDAELSTIISYPTWQQGCDTNTEVRSDPKLKGIIEELQTDPNARPGYSLHGDRLIYRGKLVNSASPLIQLHITNINNPKRTPKQTVSDYQPLQNKTTIQNRVKRRYKHNHIKSYYLTMPTLFVLAK